MTAAKFAVIDIETTGLEPDDSRILECAVIHLDAQANVTNEWSTLINVPGDFLITASAIHGIDREMLMGAPLFSDLVATITAQLHGRIAIGHVLKFDLAHLRSEFEQSGAYLPPIESIGICTRDLARANLDLTSRSLSACCDALAITVVDRHSALGDARATTEIFQHFFSLGQVDNLTDREERVQEMWRYRAMNALSPDGVFAGKQRTVLTPS